MRRPSSIFSHPTFNKIRIIILILAIAIAVSACTPTGAIDSSESREAVEAALKAEISRLEAEIDRHGRNHHQFGGSNPPGHGCQHRLFDRGDY